jgi:Asparagine synthase/Glutamine amidotransferase domain
MAFDAGSDPERFWALTVGDASRVAPALGRADVIQSGKDGPPLSLWWGDQAALVGFAQDARYVGLVQGRADGLDPADPAATLIRLYAEQGAGLVASLGGQFCAIVRDAEVNTLLCVRDPLGTHPLFYALRDGGLIVSTSPELIAGCGRAAPAPDVLAVAEWVTRSTGPMERTLHAGVTRLAPGHMLLVTGRRARASRYWAPRVTGLPGRFDPKQALGRVDAAFDRSTARLAGERRGAVMLSGGLDSAMTAAALAAHHRERGLPAPLALTMKYPDPDDDEETLARETAQALGLPHVVVPLRVAARGDGALTAGLEASRRSWYPTTNPWNIAYEHLDEEAGRHGIDVAFRGEGANDLFESPWELAGDLIRRGRLLELVRFLEIQPRYFGRRHRDYLRLVVWERGVKALIRPPVHRLLLQIAPDEVAARRAARAERSIPVWALPDQALRREVVAYRSSVTPLLASTDLFGHARRSLLGSLYISVMLEGVFLGSRRTGVENVSPFWDRDLFEVVFGLPALALQLGGHAKGLVYATVGRRVGAASTARLRAISASRTLARTYAAEIETAVSTLRGLPCLSELGIVSEPAALAMVTSAVEGGSPNLEPWRLLSTEVWLQQRFF